MFQAKDGTEHLWRSPGSSGSCWDRRPSQKGRPEKPTTTTTAFAQVEKHARDPRRESLRSFSSARRTCLPQGRRFFFGSVGHQPPGYTDGGRDRAHGGRRRRARPGDARRGWPTCGGRTGAPPSSTSRPVYHSPGKMANEARAFSMLRRRGGPPGGQRRPLPDGPGPAQAGRGPPRGATCSRRTNGRRHPSQQGRLPEAARASPCAFHPVEAAYFLSVFSKDSEL